MYVYPPKHSYDNWGKELYLCSKLDAVTETFRAAPAWLGLVFQHGGS